MDNQISPKQSVSLNMQPYGNSWVTRNGCIKRATKTHQSSPIGWQFSETRIARPLGGNHHRSKYAYDFP